MDLAAEIKQFVTKAQHNVRGMLQKFVTQPEHEERFVSLTAAPECEPRS